MSKKPDAIIYVKCDHLIPNVIMGAGNPHTWESCYDYCPMCIEEIEKKQDESQKNFFAEMEVDEG